MKICLTTFLPGGLGCALAFSSFSVLGQQARVISSRPWTVGTPIVTYWAGPPMTDATATQMAEGGWNLVWCTEAELDVAQRHGLRAQLHDGLLSPATLEVPARREKLDALIARVQSHPALYCYFITDEPSLTNFAGLGKLVAYLRQRDPAHLAYINLFPTYANNAQLGTTGDTVTAYQAHLDQFIAIVHPSLLSYDHYQFSVKGDNPDYFLNLAMIRRAAQQAGLPFLNIVQACTWTPSMRVPNPDEMRHLVYTTLAYGAQGISYYVYSCAGHTGMIANLDGTPTVRYHALKALNPQFTAIAGQLQALQSLGVYHAGMRPPGSEPLPRTARFRFDPPIADLEYKPPEPVRGLLLGLFGPGQAPEPGAPSGLSVTMSEKNQSKATHALVVNLDYKADVSVGLVGPAKLELFDATTGAWSKAAAKRIQLRLPPGGGVLLRVKSRSR
jgi:hypothetical protein